MKPATEAKANAIRAEIKTWQPGDIEHRLPLLLALLTAADAQEREEGKKIVRSMVRLGQLQQADQRTALVLIERGKRCDERP